MSHRRLEFTPLFELSDRISLRSTKDGEVQFVIKSHASQPLNTLSGITASGATLPLGQRKLITATFDGRKLAIFEDGVLKREAQLPQDHQFITSVPAVNSLFLGGPGLTIDDVRFFGQVLLPAEMKVDNAKDARALRAIHVWTFNESGGVQFRDSKGKAHGTLGAGSATRVDSISNRNEPILASALHFGPNSGPIRVPATRDMHSPNFSVAFYARNDSPTPAGRLLTFLSDRYLIAIDGNNRLEFKVKTDPNSPPGTYTGGSISNTSLPFGQRKLIVATFDGTTLSIYEDGVLKGSERLPAGLQYVTTDAVPDNFFGIGASNLTMDHVKLFDRALTAAEVADDIAKIKETHRWTFDEIAGSLMRDTIGKSDAQLDLSTMNRFTRAFVGDVIPLSASPNRLQSDMFRIYDPSTIDVSKLRHEWIVTSNNGQIIEPAIGETFSLKPQFVGRYVVTRTTVDPQGATDVDTYVVEVVPNIVATHPRTGFEGELYNVDLRGSTGTGPLSQRTYSWTFRFKGQPVATGTGPRASFVPSDDGDRAFTLEVTVEDSFSDGLRLQHTTRTTFSVFDRAPSIDFPAFNPGRKSELDSDVARWRILTQFDGRH